MAMAACCPETDTMDIAEGGKDMGEWGRRTEERRPGVGWGEKVCWVA